MLAATAAGGRVVQAGGGGLGPPGGRGALPGGAGPCRPAPPAGAGRAAGGLLVPGVPVGAGPGGTVAILKPDGSTHRSVSITALSGFIDTSVLPSSGTYSLFTDYLEAGTGDVTLSLHAVPPDFVGTIVPDGAAAVVSLNNPGQNARLNFSGTAGQRISLKVSGSTLGGTVSLLRPDGTSQAAVFGGYLPTFMEPQTLTTTGMHSIVVDPGGAGTGTVTLELHDVPPDVVDTVTVGGAGRALTLEPGQRAFITFNGTQGQQATVRVTGNTTGFTTVRLLKPDGTQLTSALAGGATFNLPTQTLAVTGSYTIVVDAQGANAGSIIIAVTSP